MNYRIIYSNELYHHGVKGMRWGVRKTIQARRRYKTSIDKSRSKDATTQMRNERLALEKRHNREGNRISDWNSKSGRQTMDRHYHERSRLIKTGDLYIKQVRLMDAGYSKKEAEVGAKWMQEHNWNIDYDDKAWLTK